MSAAGVLSVHCRLGIRGARSHSTLCVCVCGREGYGCGWLIDDCDIDVGMKGKVGWRQTGRATITA